MLVSPFAHDVFIERLPVSRMTFDPPEQMELSQTAGGVLYGADLAPRLWQGEIRLDKLTAAEEADAMTLIDVLRGGDRSALIYDLRRPWPRADRGGIILGSAQPVIQQLAANGVELSLAGLPEGYQLRRGDYLGWDYDGRRAVHKVVDLIVTATAGGTTGLFEVVPPIRPGVLAGAPVRLTRVSCLARVVPGSASPGTTGHTMTEGITLRWCQQLGDD